MGSIGLPSPSFSFLSSATDNRWYIQCMPLAGRKVFCTDHYERTILFYANTPQVDIMPNLQSPKWKPISIFVPSDAAADSHDDLEGGSIFVMESVPDLEFIRCSEQLSNQFEAFVWRKPTLNPWHHLLVPPPPFVCDPKYRRPPHISSYAVVGGGNDTSSQICISTKGAGTYSLDTVRHTWSRLGEECDLPYHGKVEYVPELKLWFGISSKDWTLATADLISAMGSSSQMTPLVVSSGVEFDPPEEWKPYQHPQLVNLGFGRFCIVRFFYTSTPLAGVLGEAHEEYFVVLTGVEVVRRDNDVSGNGIKGTDGTIEAAF